MKVAFTDNDCDPSAQRVASGVRQRPVSTPSAPSATAPAVDARSTSGPSRTARAPAADQRVQLVVGDPALGADDEQEVAVGGQVDRGERRPSRTRAAPARRRRPRPARPAPPSSPAPRPPAPTAVGPASRPPAPSSASGPAPSRRAGRPPSARRTAPPATAARASTPASVASSTASSPRSPLTSACASSTRGRGRRQRPPVDDLQPQRVLLDGGDDGVREPAPPVGQQQALPRPQPLDRGGVAALGAVEDGGVAGRERVDEEQRCRGHGAESGSRPDQLPAAERVAQPGEQAVAVAVARAQVRLLLAAQLRRGCAAGRPAPCPAASGRRRRRAP